MPTPIEFMHRYRNLKIKAVVEDAEARMSCQVFHRVQLSKYFMMDWDNSSEERSDYNTVTQGSRSNSWFRAYKDRIRNAAMGKGAPEDYELALEWAVRSGKVADVSQTSLQTYCDEFMGIDCSGFATNYLIASGKKQYTNSTVRNTGAASYFQTAYAVTRPDDIRQGDLLVWMNGNRAKTNPGHIAVVEACQPHSIAGGNLHVVEATGSSLASPKLLDSRYTIEQIIDSPGRKSIMILIVSRFGRSGSRVTVMRY